MPIGELLEADTEGVLYTNLAYSVIRQGYMPILYGYIFDVNTVWLHIQYQYCIIPDPPHGLPIGKLLEADTEGVLYTNSTHSVIRQGHMSILYGYIFDVNTVWLHIQCQYCIIPDPPHGLPIGELLEADTEGVLADTLYRYLCLFGTGAVCALAVAEDEAVEGDAEGIYITI